MAGPSKDEIVAHFREQAQFCAMLGSPFMEALCLAMASDIEKRGPVAKLVKGWKGNPRRDALSLRIAGFLHYCVLSGAAPGLAALYPAADPNWKIEPIWKAARSLLKEREAEASLFIQSPPQTNEVRRAMALLPGFLKVAKAMVALGLI